MAPSLDAEEQVKAFKEKHKIEEYALLSDARATAKSFGVRAYPTCFIIGKDGKVIWKDHFLDESAEKIIEKALDGK